MNDDELAAYGKVAEALTSHARTMAEAESPTLREKYPGSIGPIYFHYFASTFEATADSLCRLKILKGAHLPSASAGPPCCFSFECKIAEAHSVAVANWTAGPPLSELIETLIHLVAEYGTDYWGFSIDRNKPFGRGGRFEPTLQALAKIGYFDEVDEGFIWTRELELFMFRFGYWRNSTDRTKRTGA